MNSHVFERKCPKLRSKSFFKKVFKKWVSMVLVKTMVFIHFYVRKKPKLNLLLEKDFENGIDCILFLVKTNFKGGRW